MDGVAADGNAVPAFAHGAVGRGERLLQAHLLDLERGVQVREGQWEVVAGDKRQLEEGSKGLVGGLSTRGPGLLLKQPTFSSHPTPHTCTAEGVTVGSLKMAPNLAPEATASLST